MPHMYHPDLKTAPGYNPVEIADDEGLIRQMTEAGWGVVEPPEQTDPSKAAVQPGATYVVKNPEDPDEAGEYDGLTKAELSAEADKRGLAKSGTRDELVARLEADDAD